MVAEQDGGIVLFQAPAGSIASLAVNGICLTVVGLRGAAVTVEAAAETRRLTTLKNWKRGDRLHLEPALRAGDPLVVMEEGA